VQKCESGVRVADLTNVYSMTKCVILHITHYTTLFYYEKVR
jgi:hypothetical protein